MKGKELLDVGVINPTDLYEWLRGKNGNEASIISVGLPCYALLQTLLCSIKANSSGLLLLDDFEVTHFNRPQDKLLDWFFNPIMVLKEQIKVIRLEEGEVLFLEKVVLFGSNSQRMKAWNNGGLVPEDVLRSAQIQGISRRYVIIPSTQFCHCIFNNRLHTYVWTSSNPRHFNSHHCLIVVIRKSFTFAVN